MSNYGLGIITCNREDFFIRAYDSVKDYVDDIVIVNDGEKFSDKVYLKSNHTLIQHEVNKCVGISKNEALRYLYHKGYDYFFLMEDDMLIKDVSIFQKYIDLHLLTNIHHFNFGYHGPANRDQKYRPLPRLVINFSNKIKMALNRHCVGAFSFYTRKCIDEVGYMNEEFRNVFEHVDHSFNVVKKRLHPPFWWFADLHESWNYIEEQASSEVNSSIRGNPNWRENIQNGLNKFIDLHGCHPLRIPDFRQDEVVNIVNMLIKEKNNA